MLKLSNNESHSLDDTYEYPDQVKPATMFSQDSKALIELTEDADAPILVVQSKKLYIVKYGFGDASGGGFGSSIQGPDGLEVTMGTWNERGSNKSSNFRELGNLVDRLENDAIEGKLNEVELFFFY